MDRRNIQAFVYRRTKTNLQFLLLKRTSEKGGYWQPVSGGVEDKEDLLGAVKREVMEETGLTDILNIIDLHFSFIFQTTKNNKQMMMKDICFGVEVGRRQVVQLSSEHTEFKWCTETKVKQYVTWEHTVMAFEKLLKMINV